MKKKWFIVILVLVVLAIVLTIVFINLFKPRDTKALSEKLVEVTETGYLSRTIDEKQGSEENALIHEYLTGLESIGAGSSNDKFSTNEWNTISNYLNALSAYEISVEFFAREMVFAEANETYTNNHVKVQNWLSDAQKNANSLKNYIEDVQSKTQGSDYWTVQTWTDCRDWLNKLIKNTANAVDTLTEIYRASVPSHVAHNGIMNNAFTDIIFDAMNEINQNIITKTTENAEFGNQLFVLVDAYLVQENEGLILNFPYEKPSEDGSQKTMYDKVMDIKGNGKDSDFYKDFVAGKWAKA